MLFRSQYPSPTATITPSSTAFPVGTLTPTLVPTSGPTVAYSTSAALRILKALPTQIEGFTLNTDPKKTYVGENPQTGRVDGVVAVYDSTGGSELYVAIWITLNENDAAKRYNTQIDQLRNLFQVQTFPVDLGDEAVVTPSIKGAQDTTFNNAPVWGLLRFRNVVIDLYPTRALTDELQKFSKDDAVLLLTAMFDALPH